MTATLYSDSATLSADTQIGVGSAWFQKNHSRMQPKWLLRNYVPTKYIPAIYLRTEKKQTGELTAEQEFEDLLPEEETGKS